MRHALLLLSACSMSAVAQLAAATGPGGQPTSSVGFGSDTARLERAIDETRGVVSTPEFLVALARMPALQTGTHGAAISGPAVEAVYGTALAVRYERAGSWSCKHETADTRIAGSTAITTLQPIVLERYNDTLEARACTINTIAHEWTHAIVGDGKMLFTDDHHADARAPLVSYTVGAVAQCAYLARQRPLLDIAACVETVGTVDFLPCTCEPGWVDSFIAGDTACRRV